MFRYARYLTPFLLFFLSFFTYAQGTSTLTQVKLTTNYGDIILALDNEKAPNTVANFIAYVEAGFYSNTLFHRVIKGFMIQGGGFDTTFEKKVTKPTIDNEANNGLKNLKGSIAMARTSMPHSASAQFFINTVDNDFLNFRSESTEGWGYAVFGHVVSGMDVVEAIEAVATTDRAPFQNVPVENVIILDAAVIE